MAFVKTMNQMGFMTDTLDIVSQAFVDYCEETQGKVLDIGAAYGVTTLPALAAGAQVTANDLDPKHLDILYSDVPEHLRTNITLRAARFPDDLEFPKHSFQAVNASRILHFLTPDEILRGLAKIKDWLMPGGKVFLVMETPFLSDLKDFALEYKKRKLEGDLWPGYIENLEKYSQVKREQKQIPGFMTLFDKDTLSRVLAETSFEVEFLDYLNRTDFPYFMRLDGRESIGAIAVA